MPPSKLVQKFYKVNEEYRELVKMPTVRVREIIATKFHWIPPPHNTYKIN